jgi:hypothetical protein
VAPRTRLRALRSGPGPELPQRVQSTSNLKEIELLSHRPMRAPATTGSPRDQSDFGGFIFLAPTFSSGAHPATSAFAPSWLVTTEEHGQLPPGTQGGNERGPVFNQKPTHPWQRGREDCPIFGTSEPLGRQDECRHTGMFEGLEFRRSMPDAFVFRDDRPSSRSCGRKPGLIRRVIWEVVRVNLDMSPSSAQRFRDGISPKVAIDKEDGGGEPTRRRGAPFRIGLLRGSRATNGRSRRPVPQLPRRRRSVPRCSVW